jgi:transcriptional regulator with XRE-family HTH domain
MFEFELEKESLSVSGAEMKAARKKLGLSQEELARRARVDLKTVVGIEEDRILGGFIKRMVMLALGLIVPEGEKPH